MEWADKAFAADRSGDHESASQSFRRAFECERAATTLVEGIVGSEPTRSILFRSAASLALKCGELEEAKRLAIAGLSGCPSSEISEELNQVLAQLATGIKPTKAHRTSKVRPKNTAALENLYPEDQVRGEIWFGNIVGKSVDLHQVLREVEIVGPASATVLISGEPGTGKELIARAIHDHSPSRSNSFVKLDIPAVPTSLLESEMFGYEKGSFTAADSTKQGLFEIAHKGTLFLHEIGDLPFAEQAKLLRVLQEREVWRLGGSKPIKVDLRVIAATNRDLGAMVENQQFRADLYYRLAVVQVDVPPLRERPEDIPLLVRHFTHKFSCSMGKTIDMIPSETMNVLLNWHWPGNVRELAHTVERAVINSPGRILNLFASDLPAPALIDGAKENRTLDDLERAHILAVLDQTRGVLSGPNGAAALLGISRRALYFRLKELGILDHR